MVPTRAIVRIMVKVGVRVGLRIGLDLDLGLGLEAGVLNEPVFPCVRRPGGMRRQIRQIQRLEDIEHTHFFHEQSTRVEVLRAR